LPRKKKKERKKVKRGCTHSDAFSIWGSWREKRARQQRP